MSDTTNVNVPTQGTVLERTTMLVKLSRHKFNHNIMDKELSKRYQKELKVKGKKGVGVAVGSVPGRGVGV